MGPAQKPPPAPSAGERVQFTFDERSRTTLEEMAGADLRPPPIPADFLPDAETQLGILFPRNGKGIEGQLQAITSAGWDIHADEIRNATAHFLKASGLPIPNDVSTRKDWIKSISQQVNNFGVGVLEKAYPLAMRQCEGLTIGRPGALDKTLPAVIRDMKNGGKPHDHAAHQRDIDETYFDPYSGKLVHRDPATGELVPLS